MSERYVYCVRGVPSYAREATPTYATRHVAVGAKAILEAIHPNAELTITPRKRMATDYAHDEP